jgi:vitamin B12 transporter
MLFLFFTFFLFPQGKDSLKSYQLSDIVVTATRTETSIKDLANSISIIDSSEIKLRNKSSVFDLLKEEYGISFTQQGGVNKLASIYTRGANSNHTLILIDGVEANMPSDPGNSFDFSFLPADNIARIEVLRGPQSTLYGSNAMAGVISIITKKGYGDPKFNFSAEGGSYGTYRGIAGINGGLNIFNYSVVLSRFKTDGFSSASTRYGNTEKDGSDNYNLTSRVGADFLINSGAIDNLSLNLFIRFSKGNSAYDQWGGELGDDPTYIFKLEESAYRGEANLSLFNGFWKQTLGASFFRNVRKYSFDSSNIYNSISSRSLYDGRKVKLDWQNNIQPFDWNLFTFGMEWSKEDAASEYYAGSYASLFPDKNATIAGVYAQDQVKADNFFGVIGIRVDNHNKFGSVTTYRIAPSYYIPETGTKFKFTYGTAFHSPSLFDLYDPAFGNTSLIPEKNTGWDIGFDQYLLDDQITAGLTYFKNSFTNLFGYDANYRTINIDAAETHGLEFYTTVWVNSRLRIKFNQTWTKSNVIEGNGKGLPLLRRPENKTGLIVTYLFNDKFNASLEAVAVGQRDDMNFSLFQSIRVKLPAYGLANLSASYSITSYLDIYGRVDNLFNTEYEEIYGYGVAGLSGYLGIRLNL